MGLGAIRTRIVGGHGLDWRARARLRATLSSQRRRDLVEQAGIGVAGQHADERGRPEAERRPAARPLERQRVERLGAGEDRDVRARASAPAPRGRTAGPASSSASSVIRRPSPSMPDSSSRERDARGPAARGLEVDRVAVRAGLRVAEQLVELGLDPRRERALEPHRLDVALGPVSPTTEVSSHSSSAWRRKIASAAARPAVVRTSPRPVAGSTRPSAASRRHISLAAWVGHADVAPELGGRRDAAVGAHHAQREQVLLGGRRDVGGVGARCMAASVVPRDPHARPSGSGSGHRAPGAPSSSTASSARAAADGDRARPRDR